MRLRTQAGIRRKGALLLALLALSAGVTGCGKSGPSAGEKEAQRTHEILCDTTATQIRYECEHPQVAKAEREEREREHPALVKAEEKEASG
jgi:hypothetical protein